LLIVSKSTRDRPDETVRQFAGFCPAGPGSTLQFEDQIMAETKKHPAAEHHLNAAAHHAAAAHHHHEAAHHHNEGKHEDAKSHSVAAHEHSTHAHKHTTDAHAHSQK